MGNESVAGRGVRGAERGDVDLSAHSRRILRGGDGGGE